MAQKPGNRWWRLTDDPPSPKLLRWVRCVIFGLWAVLLLVAVPNVIADAKNILRSNPPGATRRAALEQLIVESTMMFVVAPFFLLAALGYGVVPRKNAGASGGPWFVSVWRSSKQERTSTKRRRGT